MKKKIFAAVAAVGVGLCAAGLAGCGLIDGGSEGLIYKTSVDKTYCTVSGLGSFTAKKVVIPKQHDGLPVKEIEKYAFENCKITSVTVPDSVTAIGEGAFSGCESLTAVTVADTVTVMGAKVFYNCKNLNSVKLSENLETLGKEAFSGCSALTEIKVTGTVTAIAEKTFYRCTKLAKATLPAGLQTIDNDAFGECYALADINFPNTLITLGKRAFCQCSALTTVYLPDGVTVLDESVFYMCRQLASLSIGGGVTDIKTNALNELNLTEMTFRGDADAWASVNVADTNKFMTVHCNDGDASTFPEE